MAEKAFTIREAGKRDEVVIAEHLCHIVLELGLPSDSVRQDWLEKTIQFIDRARQELCYRGFIAEISS